MTLIEKHIHQDIELAMVKADSLFYRDLFYILRDKKKSSILFFGIIPYTSLFVHESNNYLKRLFPDIEKLILRKQKNITRASRIRIKLFDDRDKNIPEQIEHLKWILNFWNSWLNGQHKGFLGILKRALQKDTGIFLYNEAIISSTFVGFFNIGLEKNDISVSNTGEPINLDKVIYDLGYDIGNYINILAVNFESNTNSSPSQCKYALEDKIFSSIDVKKGNFFKSIYNGEATEELNASLFLLSTSLNFLTRIFSKLVINTPDTWFKIKFLTLYHVVSSVKKMRDFYYPTNKLTNNSKDNFDNILNDNELKFLISKKEFRNILVHFSIKKITLENLNSNLRFWGIVECFFDGMSFEEVDRVIDHQISRISNILNYWYKHKDIL